MKTINRLVYFIALVGVSLFTGCVTSDLDPTLAQDKDVEGSINTPEDLYGILKGAYNRMSSSSYYGRDYIINNEVRTDNTFANGNSGRFQTVANFSYSADNNVGIWTQAYRVIASANIIIGTNVDDMEGDVNFAKHIQGQAYAIRALAHFDLLKQYGDHHVAGGKDLAIPYVTEFKGDNTIPARDTYDQVKQMILNDFQTAFDMMSDDYFDSSKEFMSKYTAKALESRAAVYFEEWDTAVKAAEAVINSGIYSVIPAQDYVSSFAQDGSSNSIFELAFSEVDNLNSNSLGFIYKGDAYGDIEVLPNVLNLYEPGDVRLDIIGYEPNYPERIRNLGKYPELNGYDNVPIIRYEEVLLNYAEALFELGRTGDAVSALNKITSQRNAAPYVTVTKKDIINERRKELIFEGFRYDDLIRTGVGIPKVDFEQNIPESIPYGDFRTAFPIPVVELDANSNMEQNPGY